MAKKITIDIEVNGKMQKATLSAKKLRNALDGVDEAQTNAGKSARLHDRNTKGAAKTTSNSTKNFLKWHKVWAAWLAPMRLLLLVYLLFLLPFNSLKQPQTYPPLTADKKYLLLELVCP